MVGKFPRGGGASTCAAKILDPYLCAMDRANGSATLDCLEKSVAKRILSKVTIFEAVCVLMVCLPTHGFYSCILFALKNCIGDRPHIRRCLQSLRFRINPPLQGGAYESLRRLDQWNRLGHLPGGSMVGVMNHPIIGVSN